MKGWFLEISKLGLSFKEGVLMVLGAINGGEGGIRFLVMVAMEEAVFAALTCLFALGWSIAGTIIGSMNRRRTRIKVVVGLITTTQLLESSNIKHNNSISVGALLRSLVIGAMLLELAACEVIKAYQWLVNMIETSYEREIREIYDILEGKGVRRDIITQLPEFKIKSMMEPCITRPSCSICLQDFMDGDNVRRLPNCKHMFHSGCIDEWLMQKRSCPICRSCVCDEPSSESSLYGSIN